MNIQLDNTANTSGTSFHGTVLVVNPKHLVSAFPEYRDLDDKVTRQWVFRFNDKVFTLYDWKATRDYTYSHRDPTYHQFWSSNEVRLHIGSAQSAHEENIFLRELTQQIKTHMVNIEVSMLIKNIGA